MYGLWLYKEIKTEYGNCKVELYRKGYTASAVEIGGFVGNSLNLALENLDTITAPIGKSVCSFSIYDTEQVEYDDLFTPDATAYKVVISTKVDGGEYNTRWSGYVTPDFFAENLSFRTPISISARDNIGYLNDVDFDLDTATITVRELIQAAFNRIAEDYPMNLSFVTQKQTAEGILAIDATISTYLLREMSWYEALETILHDLGLQMRWVDNNTIAVLDISQLGENFGLQRFNFVERSGYREILPAWRELSQKQDYGLRENFFEGWLKSNALTYVKSEGVKLPIPIGQAGTGISATMKYYAPNNWGVAGNTYTINPEDFAYLGAYGQTSTPFGKRIYFTGVDKADTTIAKNYMSWRQNVYKSTERMQITFKAFNSLLGASHSSPDTLLAYNPAERFLGINLGLTTGDYIRLGLKVNLFLHIGTKTYIMRETWEELSGAETSSLYFILDKVGDISEGDNMPKEQEISIGIGNIPANGQLELRIYGFTLEDKKNLQEDANAATYDWLRMVSYINDVTYSYANDNKNTGVESGVEIASLHNIKASEEYAFGQVTLYSGGINAYAGGLFKANGDELVGFKRNVDSTTYPLLELVGREIIHFNKKNYNKLSGTIKNLAKEPLRFDRMFIYKGKNYLPFAYSLDVISNTMNITTMQEVEPYTTHSFVEIKSELVTGGGATISGGNNTALQYSAEVGNAKRISELNNASESEKKESYIVIDNANWNESKKVPLSEMEGLDAEQVEAYLTENKYAKQSWVKGITDDLETDIANRVLIEDFDKLQEAVNLNYTNLGKATTRISTLEGYFSNGVANNAAKLGGQLPSYYATKSALDTTNTNLSNLSTTVGTIAGNLSNLTGRVSTAEDTIKGHTSSINKAVADIAANAKNISTNATNITTVANRVKTLEDLGFILKDGYIYTEKTIVSKGEIISGRRASGASTDVGGGGGISSITAQMIADALGYVPYSSANPAGYINSSALNGYATQAWVEGKKYLTAIPSEYVTETELSNALGGYQTKITSSNKLAYSLISGTPTLATVATSGKYSDLSGIPTSLPASDVYAWAKAATKPTYTASEVGALSTGGGTINGSLTVSRDAAVPFYIKNTQATNSLNQAILRFVIGSNYGAGLLGKSADSNLYRTDVSLSASYKIVDTGNYADTADKRYLQLSGGTISKSSYVPLVIQNTASDLSTILYKGASGDLGYLGFNGASNPIYMAPSGYAYTLYHTGNFNPANYLPLSGGTLTGDLTIKTSGQPRLFLGTSGSVYYSETNKETVLFCGEAGYPTLKVRANTDAPIYRYNYADYTLIHSGNIGSQSVDRAIALRGIYPSVTSTNDFYNTEQLIKYHASFSPEFGNVPSSNSWQNGLLEIGLHSGGASAQFFFSAYKRLYYRSHQTDAWHGVAYLTDNVASATKLQTARTIWGQSFDGTGNVSGILKSATESFILNDSYENPYLRLYNGNATYGYMQLVNNTLHLGYGYSTNKGIYIPTSGNVLIGTTTDSGDKLQVNGAIKADCVYNNDNATGCFFGLRKTGLGITDGGALVYAYGVNPITFYTNYSERMRIEGNGNVLIGTTIDNGARLHINASAATTLQAVTTTTSLGIAQFLAPNAKTGVTGGMVLDFGVASSTYNSGNIAFRHHSSGNAANFVSIGLYGNDNILNVFGSGNVAIGTTDSNPAYKLDVQGGDVRTSGNLIAYGEVISSRRASSSDRRLKNNITYLDTADCLAMVRHIRPAEWDWKDNGKHSMGFIAQDVEHLMPYAVTKIKDEVLEQRLNLQYDQFFAPVVGAIKCLDSEVEQLKRRVKYLENKLQKYGYNRY